MIILTDRGPFLPDGIPVGAFGEKFREERERRGFTLDDVSNVTKINSRMLKAIEDENFNLLPGGVFNKGFVRAYAKHLGFNDEESVSEYLVALRQAQVQAQTAAWQADVTPSQIPVQPARLEPVRAESQASQIRTDQFQTAPLRSERRRVKKVRHESPPPGKVKQNRIDIDEARHGVKPGPSHEPSPSPLPAENTNPAPPPVETLAQPTQITSPGPGRTTPSDFPWKVPAAALAVILLVAVLWNRHWHGVRADVASPSHTPEVQASVSNTSKSATSPSSAATSKTANLTPKPGSSSRQSAGHEVSLNSQGVRAHEPAAVPEHTPDPSSDESSAPNAAVRKSPIAAAATKPLPVFTLRIRASETSWIAVTADGQPVIHETLIAPASTSFRATREITVRVGNAAGVSFQLNGKEIPPQGNEAEVKILTFDSQGMKEASRTP
jgi:cytoskeletal protein RodZ